MRRSCLTALLLLCAPLFAGEKAHKIDFNHDVRPILADNCYACHGPDKAKRKAEFRLDTKEGAFHTLREGGFAIVAGDPAKSDLIKRIVSDDDEDHMPPRKSGKKLTAAQIATLRQWIEQGAEWKSHWAYTPPERAALPAVKNKKWCSQGPDYFVLSRLEKEGLAPAAEADKVTLIRRLSFDLTGLPPTPEDVDAFLSDKAPNAVEKVVDRLLASPHYGERMALYWLDLVRYADSAGYHSDNPRNVMPYRDYVIRAFNENKPFDQFTLEQLAGDLLPDSSLSQKVASGYNRLLQTTEEGGAQAKEYEAKYAADRVRNVSSVWLGATMGCAECHDHKFDPYSTKDFYSFAAFFADIKESTLGRREPGVPVPTEQQAAELKKLDDKIAGVKKKMEAGSPELATAQAEWEKSLAGVKSSDWKVLHPILVESSHGVNLKIAKDDAVIASGKNPESDTYTVTVKTKLKDITAFRVEALTDKAFPKNGPGRAGNGNFVLTEFNVQRSKFQVNVEPGTLNLEPVALQNASASYEQKGAAKDNPYGLWSAAAAIDGDAKGPKWGWAIMEQAGQENHAVFETQTDAGGTGEGEATLIFALKQNHGASHTLGRFRLSASTSPRPVRASAAKEPPKEVVAALAVDSAKRSEQQKQALAAHFRSISPLLQPLRDELAAVEKERDALLKNVPNCLISIADNPRMVRIKPRGNWMDDSGEVVAPAIPQFLGTLAPSSPKGAEGKPQQRVTRLDLAKWIVARENPLAARVFMNRMWKLFFGQGLSKNLDDLGAMGEAPSHPELLDWLAIECQEKKWDTKGMVKMLVLSSAYRQTSVAGKELKERDPYNRLYARQSRFRLDAETIRDGALAISGLLARSVGGESVKPYQPAGYWQYLNFPTREWKDDSGESLHRRGIYTWWQRTFLHPSLLNFDAPSREECCAERPRSNTPQQALTLLNDPTYVEASRVFAQHIVKDGGAKAEERLQWACRKALSRAPSKDEARLLMDLYQRNLQRYATDKKAAEQFVSVGASPAPKDVDAAELAAWTSVARVILNLHEAITRY